MSSDPLTQVITTTLGYAAVFVVLALFASHVCDPWMREYHNDRREQREAQEAKRRAKKAQR